MIPFSMVMRNVIRVATYHNIVLIILMILQFRETCKSQKESKSVKYLCKYDLKIVYTEKCTLYTLKTF